MKKKKGRVKWNRESKLRGEAKKILRKHGIEINWQAFTSGPERFKGSRILRKTP